MGIIYGGIRALQRRLHLIVPDPGNGNKYYLFTVDQLGGQHGLVGPRPTILVKEG